MTLPLRNRPVTAFVLAMALSWGLIACGGKKKGGDSGGDEATEDPAPPVNSGDQPNVPGPGGDGGGVLPDPEPLPDPDPTPDPTPTAKKVYFVKGFLALATGDNSQPDNGNIWSSAYANSRVGSQQVLTSDYSTAQQQVSQ